MKIPSRNNFANAPGNITIAQTLGIIDEAHHVSGELTMKSKSQTTTRYQLLLVSKMGKELKTSLCVQYKKGFHVNCFTAFPYRGALSTSRKLYFNLT
jgi:cellobiose-specific phosphotransferase system component IIA